MEQNVYDEFDMIFDERDTWAMPRKRKCMNMKCNKTFLTLIQPLRFALDVGALLNKLYLLS